MIEKLCVEFILFQPMWRSKRATMKRRRKLLLMLLSLISFLYLYVNWTDSLTELLRSPYSVGLESEVKFRRPVVVNMVNVNSSLTDLKASDSLSHLHEILSCPSVIHLPTSSSKGQHKENGTTTKDNGKFVQTFATTELEKERPYYDNNSGIVDKEGVEKPVQVIIVTKMRSGSSFTGEIFNRNDDFVYYFEPLNEMKVDRKDTTAGFAGTSYQSVLKGILNCDFSNFKGFNWWNGRRPNQQCIQSRAYQQTSLCVSRGGKFRTSKDALSGSEKNSINEQTCKGYQNIAIKTVRLSDIGVLKELVQDSSLNIKIVHLVRDPRAVSNSRQGIRDPDNPTNDCQNVDDNLQKYWINPPDWIRGRYMLLRYEDLAEKPQYTIDKVYEFLLNTPAPHSVHKWLEENTKHDASTGRKQDMKWSHTKDSAKTAHAWRTKLLIKSDKLLEAQRGCEKVMRLLGYKPVTSGAQMRDLNYSTLEGYQYPLLPNTTIDIF